MKYIKISFLVLGIAFGLQVNAQKKPKQKVIAVAKPKAPKLKTTLGTFKDSASISVDQGIDLIAKPLAITDDKNNIYTVKSYQFLYKKIGVTEDEQTEKLSPISTISSSYFYASPLPKVWVTTIQQHLQKGEMFYFFDIVVNDPKGGLVYAPPLKLIIQ
jgi:hypothetical protein